MEYILGALKLLYMGTPLRPKCVLCGYMDPGIPGYEQGMLFSGDAVARNPGDACRRPHERGKSHSSANCLPVSPLEGVQNRGLND